MKAQDVLEASIARMKKCAAERDSPDGERSMRLAVELFNTWTGNVLSESEGWQFMVALKMARSAQGKFNKDDSIDHASYAALHAECASASPED